MPHDRGFDGVERRLDRGANTFVREAVARADYWRNHKSIKPETFSCFDIAMVQADIAKAKELGEKFARRDTPQLKEEAMTSNMFEVGLWWLIRNKGFLGEKTNAILPSRYDDYVNGIDLILELTGLDEQVTHLGIGIDATFGVDAVENKLADLNQEVHEAIGAEAKYFRSSDGKYEGSLKGIPHAIVGFSVAHARELSALWRRSEQGEKLDTNVHPLRVLLLEQLVMQAAALRDLCEVYGYKELGQQYRIVNARLSPVYMKALSMVTDKKAWIDQEGSKYREDPVYVRIMEQIAFWNKEVKEKRAQVSNEQK